MSDPLIKYVLIGLYVAVLLAVAFYGMHRYVLVYLYFKHRHNGYTPLSRYSPEDLPHVTVQLPMYNEGAVAERIIRATCEVDYPRDKMEVQVLDDSTDESAEVARAACEMWASKGYPVKYVHRQNRNGYKAGALAEGLKTATGEFVCIFDADFIPPRDILHNVVHYFNDPKVGMVQVRWDHLNREASLLTRSQAIFLDGHFVIEHTARNRSGRFMHFNGTAGIWRRRTIEDAGGWTFDTLTEDLDLSYRAQVNGWQFVYLPQHAAPAELPPEMLAFKQQAHRWTKGSFQTALKLLPGILKNPNLPAHVKSEAFFHLTNTIVYPLMVLLTLLMYPTFIYVDGPIKNATYGNLLFSITLFILATCSASTFFIFGQSELLGSGAGWRALLHLPVLMGLGVGLSINNSKAVFEAMVSTFRGKPSEFVRTPKYGVTGRARANVRTKDALSLKRLTLPIIEIAFGFYMMSFVFISLYYEFARASIPFLLIFCGGYFYVGFSSLMVLWNMHRESTEAIEPAPVVVDRPAIT